MKNNQSIRTYAKKNSVYLWRIADRMECSYDTLIRKLRHELPESEKQEIIKIIDELSKRKGE